MEVFLSRIRQKTCMLGKELPEPEIVRNMYNRMLSLYRSNIHLEKCRNTEHLIKYARRVESIAESLMLDHPHVGVIMFKTKSNELVERDSKQTDRKTMISLFKPRVFIVLDVIALEYTLLDVSV